MELIRFGEIKEYIESTVVVFEEILREKHVFLEFLGELRDLKCVEVLLREVRCDLIQEKFKARL